MNFFYGINNDLFKSEIQIPLFQNKNLKSLQLNLYKTYPKNKKWILKEIKNKKINNYFCILKNEDVLSNEIFFLANKTVLDEFNEEKLVNFNNFTDTIPAYRANFKIYKNQGGFSSYQSEYPYSMTTKTGTILSPISSLANLDADKNYILLRNIFEAPIEELFSAYLINYRTKKIEKQFRIKTNYTNCIEIDKSFIKPEIFLITDKYLGIPMYVSEKNNFLSFEHTHPPHEYILGDKRFLRVNNLKKEVNEIINKKNS